MLSNTNIFPVSENIRSQWKNKDTPPTQFTDKQKWLTKVANSRI